MTLPTVADIRQRAVSLGNADAYVIDMYTIELQDSGYYDVEWLLLPDMPNNYDVDGYRIVFTDRKAYYDYTNHYYSVKEQQDFEIQDTSWIVSFDAGGQWIEQDFNYLSGPRIRDWDGWSCTLDSYSISEGGLNWGPTLCEILTRQVKNVVLNNFHNESGWYNWFRLDNDTLNPDGLTVFYNNPTRERFDDTNWFMGVYPRCTKLYLHPTIYAMNKHGFDGTVPGWTEQQLQDFLDNGGQLYEMPNNWRTLIPNYIGV
jgi:hypothetical protein